MNLRWALALGVVALVMWRAITHPVDVYGDSAAGYIEHLERIRSLRPLLTDAPLWDRLHATDGMYPPLLHLFSAPASFLGDHAPGSVTPLGAFWLALLAVAVGTVSRAFAPETAQTAALTVFLTPCLHAVAPRYYYDLPMATWVWCSAACVVRAAQHPWRNGVAAGLLFALAAGTKWSALPLGLPIVLAAAWAIPRPAAFRALGAALVTIGLILTPALSVSRSFGAMGGATFQIPPGVQLPSWSLSLDAWMPGIGHALGAMAVQLANALPGHVLFYAERLPTTILAPAIAFPVIAAFVFWLVADRRGAAFLATSVVPVVAFVVGLVPPTDERFLLTVVPAMAVPVAMAAERSHRNRRIAAATACVALVVAVDFHTGFGDTADTPETSGQRVPPRWGLSTSIDRRGWARADDLPDARTDTRDALVRLLASQQYPAVTGADQLLTAAGDLNWWTFESERQAFLTGAPTWVFLPEGSSLGPLPAPPSLVFRPIPADRFSAPTPPPEGWEACPPLNDRVAIWAPRAKCPDTQETTAAP